MAIICPTVTETHSNPHEYRAQLERLLPFATRVHIDLMDGHFAPTKSINPVQVWWPEGVVADIHLMFQKPLDHIETLVSLKPSMVIIHAEAEGDLSGMVAHMKRFGVKMGLAMLAETHVQRCAELLCSVDHALVFSGDLGNFGGEVDLRLLDKVQEIRSINQNIEIGWDGGANARNVEALAAGGIDVINVGGAIQKSEHADTAYATLVSKIT